MFLEEEYETIEEFETPQEAAANHVGRLPCDDGLDYPDDFWEIVVPIAEGERRIDLAPVADRPGAWRWPKGASLTWPLIIEMTLLT
ncbi:MAG: hypothetical protein QGH94_03260 [Phycisphaerae bacterium]|jgi:hypothetical protein|nr:hypothetical protein [Phycisphaerae bacterium]MDP7286994.1 hypothetical protein [Phycisphaerae bacterium]